MILILSLWMLWPWSQGPMPPIEPSTFLLIQVGGTYPVLDRSCFYVEGRWAVIEQCKNHTYVNLSVTWVQGGKP